MKLKIKKEGINFVKSKVYFNNKDFVLFTKKAHSFWLTIIKLLNKMMHFDEKINLLSKNLNFHENKIASKKGEMYLLK